MNILFNILNVGVLSADLDIETIGPIEVVHAVGGSSDTLYKGAMVGVGTDGYLAVISDITDLYPLGIMKKQVIVAGSNAENIEVLQGKFWIPLSGASQEMVGQVKYASDDATLASSATNVEPLGICVDFKTGYLLIDTRQRTRKV